MLTCGHLLQVNSLLPTDTFITVMRGLMGNELPSVRRKAMDLLNTKLQHRTQWDPQQVSHRQLARIPSPHPSCESCELPSLVSSFTQVTALLQLKDNLLSIVGKSHTKVEEEEAEQAINRQTALFGLKLLCRNFGADHQEAMLPVLLQTVELIMAPDEEKNVMASALLCIAEVVSTLRALAIPQLPR